MTCTEFAVAALIGVFVASLAACDEPSPTPTDGDADTGADTDAGDSVDADGPQADADGPAPDAHAVGGPITTVIDSLALTDERLCDLDGDGMPDNAVADLGSPSSGFAAMAINTLVGGAFDRGWRMVLHSPWVDDVSGPTDEQCAMIILEGTDEDDPPNMGDDFSGREGFYAAGGALDGCGEPLYFFGESSLENGVFFADAGILPMPFGGGIYARQAQAHGVISPGGEGFEATICGFATIHDLGGQPGIDEAGDLNMLEVLLAGGTSFGLPLLPGLNPDIDVDGDGIESFVTDTTGVILSCIDGDRTTISGRSCWEEETMADAFSLTARLTGVGARFVGREPGWETDAVGECPDGPPEMSRFDPR